jgi:rhodanese-related sulfurtransferase
MRGRRGTPETPQVNVEEGLGLVQQGALLLDVRELDEWQAGRAAEALHIPLGMLGARLEELPKDRKIVVICRSGARSAAATDGLVARGYDAVNFGGGMQAWSAAGHPIIAEDGGEGAVI